MRYQAERVEAAWGSTAWDIVDTETGLRIEVVRQETADDYARRLNEGEEVWPL